MPFCKSSLNCLSVGSSKLGEKMFLFLSVTNFTFIGNGVEFLIRFQKDCCCTKYNAIIGAGVCPLSVIAVPTYTDQSFSFPDWI
jgi:hypothetical protein